ncbi:MAG: OadG family protein [Prolixibacteraceae bacterium]|nr:OadG family protein [Prolixibacteraceae bacterium]
MAEALKLLLTGMSTVFFILIMVVLLGNLIIIVTNKFTVTTIPTPVQSKTNTNEIEPAKLAAIVSAVDITTKGRGKVSSIERMS